MISSIFAAIELILKLIGLWEQFQSFAIQKAQADREERKQVRDKAVNSEVNSKTEEEFDKAQSDIAKNLPRP